VGGQRKPPLHSRYSGRIISMYALRANRLSISDLTFLGMPTTLTAAVPHSVSRDDLYNGYRIPKGSMLMMNVSIGIMPIPNADILSLARSGLSTTITSQLMIIPATSTRRDTQPSLLPSRATPSAQSLRSDLILLSVLVGVYVLGSM
jgi:hypothetical protein